MGGLVTSVQWKDKPDCLIRKKMLELPFDQQSKQHVVKVRRLLDDLLQKGDRFNRFRYVSKTLISSYCFDLEFISDEINCLASERVSSRRYGWKMIWGLRNSVCVSNERFKMPKPTLSSLLKEERIVLHVCRYTNRNLCCSYMYFIYIYFRVVWSNTAKVSESGY